MSSAIAETVRCAGVVGAGGAGFPTHVEFAARADTVIANGAECAPLRQCDKAVMRLRTAGVLRGLSLLGEAVAAERLVIALKGVPRRGEPGPRGCQRRVSRHRGLLIIGH